MLQWMGGSRRKVDTSRRSTQKRQKQFFEQRKWQEQQKKDARESFFEEKSPSNQQEKNSRSLDILSLLNLSTGSGEHKSNVHSGTMTSTFELSEILSIYNYVLFGVIRNSI